MDVENILSIVESGEGITFGLFIDFFNIFCAAGGLRAVLDLLTAEKDDELSTQLPLIVISDILFPFCNLKSIGKDEILKELVAVGKRVYFDRFEKLSVNELKFLNLDDIAPSLKIMKKFLKLQNSEEFAGDTIKKYEMILCNKLIQCPFFEKKISGIEQIKDFICLVENNQIKEYKPLWLTASYLGKWIKESKVLENIFNENAQTEIIKRANFIIIFLLKQGIEDTKIVDILWNCQKKNEEEIKKVVLDMLIQTVGNFENEVG